MSFTCELQRLRQHKAELNVESLDFTPPECLVSPMPSGCVDDEFWMRKALSLARKGVGRVSPNPAVGAVLVLRGKEIGSGWHRVAGGPHAEVEAISDAMRRGKNTRGSTLYVTLEPCSTHGRTPPCTKAILDAGIKRVVVAATDPNPKHAGRGLDLLRAHGIRVEQGICSDRAESLNEAFTHWIVHRTPLVTLKAAMTLDGKIATAAGESKWITGPEAGREAMKLRWQSDAIIAGINTVLADDPSLTCRSSRSGDKIRKRIRRIVLDSKARTPLNARVVSDEHRVDTIIVVGRGASTRRIARLEKRVSVWRAPMRGDRISLKWLLNRLGKLDITHLLVEGGGEVNGAFVDQGLAHRVAFFYAPLVLGGRESKPGVAGAGATQLAGLKNLTDVEWRKVGADLMLTARIG